MDKIQKHNWNAKTAEFSITSKMAFILNEVNIP